jgi:hypothetical protein
MKNIDATAANAAAAIPGGEEDLRASTDRAGLAAEVALASPADAQAAADKLLGADRIDIASRTRKDTPDAKDRRNRGKWNWSGDESQGPEQA